SSPQIRPRGGASGGGHHHRGGRHGPDEFDQQLTVAPEPDAPTAAPDRHLRHPDRRRPDAARPPRPPAPHPPPSHPPQPPPRPPAPARGAPAPRAPEPPEPQQSTPQQPVAARPRVELVFALDTTGSMSGLIEGAKRKIWSLASYIAQGQPTPDLRVGLI